MLIFLNNFVVSLDVASSVDEIRSAKRLERKTKNLLKGFTILFTIFPNVILALEATEHTYFSLIFIQDSNLSHLNPVDLLKNLRNVGCLVPIVLISANLTAEIMNSRLFNGYMNEIYYKSELHYQIIKQLNLEKFSTYNYVYPISIESEHDTIKTDTVDRTDFINSSAMEYLHDLVDCLDNSNTTEDSTFENSDAAYSTPTKYSRNTQEILRKSSQDFQYQNSKKRKNHFDAHNSNFDENFIATLLILETFDIKI